MKLLFLSLLSLFATTLLPAQPARVHRFPLQSKATGQQYELSVSLPQGYAEKDTARYPVLYVLDGDFMFPVMHSMHHLLREVQEVQDLIVVGIGYRAATIMESMKFRTPDYTPTVDTAFERMFREELQIEVKTGGAPKFLQALKEEIFPFIEKRYRTGGRGLAGHSFGALFGGYVLLQEPAVFSQYLMSSISMPWDNSSLLRQEGEFFKRGTKELHAQVFLSAGAEETDGNMISGMQELARSLRSRQYRGLVIEERVLPNESHGSAFLTAFNQGLRVLYPRRRQP